jgi:hypothetical protein
MVKAEQARRAAEARVERQLAELERVRAVHQEAKRKGVPGYVRDRYGPAAGGQGLLAGQRLVLTGTLRATGGRPG